MDAGTARHLEHGSRVRRASMLGRVAFVLLGLAMLFALALVFALLLGWPS